MGNWFSPQAQKITAQDQAMLDLKIQRDKLKQYSTKLSVVIDRETHIAKTLLSQGKKDRARVALRRKRYQETLLNKTDETLVSVAEMVDAIEFAMVEKQVVNGLKQGNSVLAQLNKEIGGVQGVEDLLDDTAEAVRQQEEIDAALSEAFTTADDDAVTRELAELEAGVVPASASEMPAVPTSAPDLAEHPESGTDMMEVDEYVTVHPVKQREKLQKQAVPA